MHNIADLRKSYQKHSLLENEVNSDPFIQFNTWFNEALEVEVPEPNAFTLSTVDIDGRPSSRIVLLKGIEDQGFIFYTNYESKKSRDMSQSNLVAMCFLWHELERQVRICGTVEKVSREESERYFHSRPRESQLGAWVSNQSEMIPSRAILEENMTKVIAQYQNEEKIPLPDHWGGFRIIADEIEFWQGRSNRLHDRLRYRKVENNWSIERLAP